MPHDPADYPLLLRMYAELQMQPYLRWYEFRVRENDINTDFTFVTGLLLLTIGAVLALTDGLVLPSTMMAVSVIATVLAFVPMFFRQLYGWDRQSNLYRTALATYKPLRVVLDEALRLPGICSHALRR
jgi:hypothetical protein